MVESRYAPFLECTSRLNPPNRYLIDPPITSAERLKTGADTLRSKPNPVRAEFFALPAFVAPLRGYFVSSVLTFAPLRLCVRFCLMAGLEFVSSHGFVLRLPRVSVSDPAPDPELITFLRNADLEQLGGYNSEVVPLVRSLLLLTAGDLERAHILVQEASNADGTYIHGIVHRTEGDFDNARYWFRRTSVHTAAPEIYRRAAVNSPRVASCATWDPVWVTDWVEASKRTGADEELRAVLAIEAEVLLEHFASQMGE